MSLAEKAIVAVSVTFVLLAGAASLASGWLERWDRRLAERAAPNARLLIHHGHPEPLPPRHRRGERWTPGEYAAATGLDSLRHGHPTVRPQPAPVVPRWEDPDATTATLTVVDPPGGAR